MLYFVRMDSCATNHIEIVPNDNSEGCSDVTNVKSEPSDVKVCFL